MKHGLLILFTIVTIDSSTVINLPSGVWLAVVPQSCDVVGTTPTVKVPAVSTGPYLMRVSTQPNSDCYIADRVNPNGSLFNERWTKCP